MVEAFSIAAAIAAAVQTVALIALHILPTGYNPVSEAISDYGIGRYRAWFWTQAMAGGLAKLTLALALAEATPSVPTLVVVMLLTSAAASFLIPAFPTDQHGSRFQTRSGTVHMILAIVVFTSLIIAASKLGGALENAAAWHEVKSLLIVLPWVMTGSAIGILLALRLPRLHLIFGLIERLFYVSAIAWLFVVSIELARIAS
jgi:hypothetical protein